MLSGEKVIGGKIGWLGKSETASSKAYAISGNAEDTYIHSRILAPRVSWSRNPKIESDTRHRTQRIAEFSPWQKIKSLLMI